MKIRNGFVSNSSSSSYIITGNVVDYQTAISSIEKAVILTNKSVGGEGEDTIDLDDDFIKQFIKIYKVFLDLKDSTYVINPKFEEDEPYDYIEGIEYNVSNSSTDSNIIPLIKRYFLTYEESRGFPFKIITKND